MFIAEKNYEEAAKLELEVIQGRERILGPNHKDTLDSKHSYAVTLQKLNRFKESESLFLEVIEKS